MSILIYGANGYTGELVARRAAQQGHRPILAGRRTEGIAALAQNLGLEHRAFALDRSQEEIDRGLAGVKVVLSCAGPFVRTALPLAGACLRARSHYLDITGEVAVFEALQSHDREARAAGVMLLPGAGFDVVPSDCLAAHLRERLPSATHLRLAFRSTGRLSRGTALTALEGLGQGGLVRRDGALVRVPAGHRTIEVDFGGSEVGRGSRDGDRRVKAIAIPWGDVFTAYVTTAIPNIEVYAALPAMVRLALRSTRVFGRLLMTARAQQFLAARVRRASSAGPSADERRKGQTHLWGEARDTAGNVVVSRLRTPDAYELTSILAVALAARAHAGDAPTGYQTPARAYGADFVLGFPGVSREDADS